MPSESSRLSTLRWTLAPGVRLGDGVEFEYLIDDHLEARHPMNGSARAILAMCDGSIGAQDLWNRIAQEYEVSVETVAEGAEPLLLSLNNQALVQPTAQTPAEEWRAYRSLLMRMLGWPLVAPSLRRRLVVDLSMPMRTLAQVTLAVYHAWRIPWWVLAASSLLVFLEPMLLWIPLGAVALYGAICVHEFGHLITAWLVGIKAVCIHYRLGAVSVVRQRVGILGETAIGLGGPAVPILVGAALWQWSISSPLKMALAGPFLLQAITILPIFDDSPAQRLYSVAKSQVVQGVTRMFRSSRHRWLSVAGKSVLAFVAGTIVTVIGLLILGLILSIAADVSGWGSFRVAPLRLHLYSFHKEPGGFETEFGEGLYYLAVVAGLLNAVMVSKRSLASHQAL